MENKYLILKRKQEKRINDFPQFFAFSNEQLQEGLKKLNTIKEEILSTFGGGFIRKSDKEKYKEMWEIINKETENKRKDEKFLYSAFLYEMANHEYGYSQDDEEVLNAIGINDLNKKELEIYQKAKEEYFNTTEL